MHHAEETALFEIEAMLKEMLFKNPKSYFYNGNLVVEDGGKGDVLNLKALLTSIDTKLDAALARDKKEITDLQFNERLSVIKNQVEVLKTGVYASETTTSKYVSNDLIIENFDVDVSELLKKVEQINEKVKQLPGTPSSPEGGTTGGDNDDNSGDSNSGNNNNGGNSSSSINQDNAVIAWLRAPGILQGQSGLNYNKSFVSDPNSNLLVTAVSDSLLLIKLVAQGKEGKKFFGAIPLITCQISRQGDRLKSMEAGTSVYPMFDSSIVDYEYFEDDFANESGIKILVNTNRNYYKSISRMLTFNLLLFKPAKSSQSVIAFSSDKIPNHNPHGDVDIFEHEKGEYIVRFEGIEKSGVCVGVGFDNCDVNFVGWDSNSRGTTVKLKVERDKKPVEGGFSIAYITDEKAFLNSKNDLQIGLYSNLESEIKINKTVSGEDLGKITGSFGFSGRRGAYHIIQSQPLGFSDSNYDPLESIVFSQLCDLNSSQEYICLRDEFSLLIPGTSLAKSPTLQVNDLKGSYIKLALGQSK